MKICHIREEHESLAAQAARELRGVGRQERGVAPSRWDSYHTYVPSLGAEVKVGVRQASGGRYHRVLAWDGGRRSVRAISRDPGGEAFEVTLRAGGLTRTYWRGDGVWAPRGSLAGAQAGLRFPEAHRQILLQMDAHLRGAERERITPEAAGAHRLEISLWAAARAEAIEARFARASAKVLARLRGLDDSIRRLHGQRAQLKRELALLAPGERWAYLSPSRLRSLAQDERGIPDLNRRVIGLKKQIGAVDRRMGAEALMLLRKLWRHECALSPESFGREVAHGLRLLGLSGAGGRRLAESAAQVARGQGSPFWKHLLHDAAKTVHGSVQVAVAVAGAVALYQREGFLGVMHFLRRLVETRPSPTSSTKLAALQLLASVTTFYAEAGHLPRAKAAAELAKSGAEGSAALLHMLGPHARRVSQAIQVFEGAGSAFGAVATALDMHAPDHTAASLGLKTGVLVMETGGIWLKLGFASGNLAALFVAGAATLLSVLAEELKEDPMKTKLRELGYLAPGQ